MQHLISRFAFFLCILDGETEQEAHQRIPLLSAFMLLDFVPAPYLISPHITAWYGID